MNPERTNAAPSWISLVQRTCTALIRTSNQFRVRLPLRQFGFIRRIPSKSFREEIMAGIDRRKFLQSSGGLAGILASGRAPAFAQTTTLHWLRLGDFVARTGA